MPEHDALAIVEAAYRWIEDPRAWLDQLLAAAEPFSVGSGVAAYTVSLDDRPAVHTFVGRDTPPMVERSVRTMTTAMSRPVARELYAPTEFVGNARYRLARIAKARRRSPLALAGGRQVSAWALLAGDVRTEVVALMFPAATRQLAPDQPFPHARTLGLVGAHVGAALRLRKLVAPMSAADDATEAVMSPSGKVVHAAGEARERDAREALVDAVARSERARGRLRRQRPEEAAAAWTALVDGRWSVVDFVDRDGKRMLLARRNPVDGRDVLGMTPRERDVAWLATHGHSNKFIAYELGLSTAQVARCLVTALRKLRVRSRRELLHRFGGPPRTK